MNSAHENDAENIIKTARARAPLSFQSLAFAGTRLISTAVLISFSVFVQAALIEIPAYQHPESGSPGNGRESLLSWQPGGSRSYLNGYGIFPAPFNGRGRSNRPALNLMHVPGTRIEAHALRVADTNGYAADLYAAIDAPYGSINSSKPSSDSDPELWTIFLVAASLIGYQIRRKSRVGAIRIRPLQDKWQRPA